MYAHPEVQFTHFSNKNTFLDPLGQQARTDIRSIGKAVECGLNDVLKDAEEALKNPGTTPVDMAALVQKLQTLSQSAQHMSAGLDSLHDGQKTEEAMLNVAAQSSDRLDSWVEQAHAHFKKAQEEARQGVSLASEQNVIDHVIDNWEHQGTAQEKKKNFFEKAGRVLLTLETMAVRVYTFPDLLAEKMVSFYDDRASAVRDTVKDWAARSETSYVAMRARSDALMTQISDVAGASIDTSKHVAESLLVAGGLAAQKGLNSFMNFLRDEAGPALVNAVKSTINPIQHANKWVAQDFSESLKKRREKHTAETPSAIEQERHQP